MDHTQNPSTLARDLAERMIAYCGDNPNSVERAQEVLQAIAAIAAAATTVGEEEIMIGYFLAAYRRHVATLRMWRTATRH